MNVGFLALHIFTSVPPSKSECACFVQISAGVKNNLKSSTHQSTKTSKAYQAPLKKNVLTEDPKETERKNYHDRRPLLEIRGIEKLYLKLFNDTYKAGRNRRTTVGKYLCAH